MLSEIIANAKSKHKKKGNALLPNTLLIKINVMNNGTQANTFVKYNKNI